MDKKLIEKKSRELLVKLWTKAKSQIGDKCSPFDILNPEYAAKELGVEFKEIESLGSYTAQGVTFEVAGIIDRKKKTISISNRFDKKVKRFTAAHEIGHYLLHEELISHRDKPLSGSELKKDKIEREADYFASCFLMPRKLVIEEFKDIFGTDPLKIDETLRFALGYKNQNKFFSNKNKPLFYEKLLASASTVSGQNVIPIADRFKVSKEAMAIRLEELKLTLFKDIEFDDITCEDIKAIEPDILHSKFLGLPTTSDCIFRIPLKSNIRLVVLQHALRDTSLFLNILKKAGFTIGAFIAKPNSINLEAIDQISKMGIPAFCEPESDFKPYHFFENSPMLSDILNGQIEIANLQDQKIIIIDVGGYFANSILKLDKFSLNRILGVVEVTTFGHNRYEENVVKFPVPIVSIARSPLKEAEAIYVGDTVIRATEDLLQSFGHCLNGKVCTVVGFGMIGSEIALALQKRNIRTIVVDNNPIALMKATLKHFETSLTLKENISQTDILFSSTGKCAVSLDVLKHAKDNILLVSGGSRSNEFDIAGIKSDCINKKVISDYVKCFEISNGKKILIANEGKAVNFLKDGTPEAVMDLVFAEQVESIRSLLSGDLKCGVICQVSENSRKTISHFWMKNQKLGILNRSEGNSQRLIIQEVISSFQHK